MYMIMTDRGWRPFHALNKPCPNSNDLKGVFRPMSHEQARASNAARAERFCALMREGDAAQFSESLFGAFGEKL